MGMPYNIDGTMSKHGRRVQEFAQKLESIIEIPVVLHDERLSSSEASMAFEEDGEYGDIDAEAARLILMDYLKTLS
ncbi:MAG: Holliday junction resolvase RuvX [Patescibacteria group bacterium]